MTTFVPTRDRSYRLGTDVQTATSLGQALDLAGMNWGLKTIDAGDMAVRSTDEDGNVSGWVKTRIPGGRLVMRDDNWDIMGVVGSGYGHVTNAEAFGIVDTLRTEMPGLEFERAFELDHGREAYLSMAMPSAEIRIGDGATDVIKPRLRFSTTHDGGGSIRGFVELSRLVCTNGMTVPIEGTQHTYKIRHSVNAHERLQSAHLIMAGAGQYIAEFARYARFLVDTPMSDLEFGAFIDDLFPQPHTNGSRFTWSTRERADMGKWERRRQQLLSLFRRAETNESGRGTRWAALNTVTEHADWGSTVRQGSAQSLAEARALRQLEGTNQSIKDAAFTRLSVGLAA
jgi:phage/plasmid-like protein (TIGR03299 family)